MFSFLKGRVNAKFGAFLCVLILLVFTAGFTALFIILFRDEAAAGVASILSKWPTLGNKLSNINLGSWLEKIPFLNQFSDLSDSLNLSTMVNNSLQLGVGSILTLIKKGIGNISLAAVHFLLILFLMFFLYLDGPNLLKKINDLIPLGDRETKELFDEIVNVSRATAVSTLVIGIIEGTYGSILFLIFRLPSPVFWGFVMILISMIPLIGTNAVLIPAGIILIITGRWVSGLLLIVSGVIGISLSQYLLKPKLLGNRTGLHPALILLSILGGLIWLGLIGFLVGPMIASLFIVIWNQFGIRFREELTSKNLPRD